MLYEKQLIKAKKQKRDIYRDVDVFLMFESANITDKVKKRWSWGKSVNGDIIAEYSKSALGQKYRAYKLKKNPKAKGVVDLINTGSLSNKLLIKKIGSLFEVASSDHKFNKIGFKYGFEEFNLTPEETKQLISEIYEKIIINYTYSVWQNV